MDKKNNKYSLDIIVPCFNEEGNIEKLISEIENLNLENYRLIFVNDGSSDHSLEVIKSLSSSKRYIKYISFSKNFGHQAALRAGIKYSNANALITMDADLQHPPELIPRMIKKWQEGNQVVYTKRDDNKSSAGRFKKITSKLFYYILNKLSGLDMSFGMADYRLLDKSVVKVINEIPEKQLFFRGFIAWCGFNQYEVEYIPNRRFSGKSGYTFKKMVSLAIQGITSFSIRPLKVSTILGFISALIGVIYGVYALIQFLLDNNVAGWTSVTITVLIMGGVQLIILGIIGEYIGSLFIETKSRPDYIIMEENINGQNTR